MLPGINPRQLEKAMRRMGVKQEELEATEVIIKTRDKELVIHNPSVAKVNMMGQESFQVTGEIEEREPGLKSEDVRLIMEKTGCIEENAKKALEEASGNLAEAILKVKSQ